MIIRLIIRLGLRVLLNKSGHLSVVQERESEYYGSNYNNTLIGGRNNATFRSSISSEGGQMKFKQSLK